MSEIKLNTIEEAIEDIKNGKVIDKLVGAQPKSNFVKKIEAHIA